MGCSCRRSGSACFTAPGHVALTWTEDRKDPQYEISRDAYQRLRHARDARGRRLTVHKIHQPGPLYMTAEEAAGIDVPVAVRLVGARKGIDALATLVYAV